MELTEEEKATLYMLNMTPSEYQKKFGDLNRKGQRVNFAGQTLDDYYISMLDKDSEYDFQLKKQDVLEANKDVPFVDRILNPDKYPVQKNKDGSISTHLMAYGESDGKYVVYPTLQWDGEKLVKGDFNSALKNNNVIYFETEQEAENFAGPDAPWKEVLEANMKKK